MPKERKKLTRAEYDDRVDMLIDRLALTLTMLKQRHGDDWNPWIGEAMWDDADSIGDILRNSPDYGSAVKVVGLFISRLDA